MTEQEQQAFDAMRDALENIVGDYSSGTGQRWMIDEALTAANAVSHPQATEPAGWKLVPVEPTPEMLYAIQDGCDILPPRGKRVWSAMLAAAPEAP